MNTDIFKNDKIAIFDNTEHFKDCINERDHSKRIHEFARIKEGKELIVLDLYMSVSQIHLICNKCKSSKCRHVRKAEKMLSVRAEMLREFDSFMAIEGKARL